MNAANLAITDFTQLTSQLKEQEPTSSPAAESSPASDDGANEATPASDTQAESENVELNVSSPPVEMEAGPGTAGADMDLNPLATTVPSSPAQFSHPFGEDSEESTAATAGTPADAGSSQLFDA